LGENCEDWGQIYFIKGGLLGEIQELLFAEKTLAVLSYTLNGLKPNFLDRITGLAGLDLYPVYPIILSK